MLRHMAGRRRGALVSALILFTILASTFRLWAPSQATNAVNIVFRVGQSSRPSGSVPAGSESKQYATQYVELEGLKMGAPLSSKQKHESSDEYLPALISEIHGRYVATLSTAPSYPQCSPDLKRYERLLQGDRSSSSNVVSIAINLHNSEHIIPAQSTAILQALAFLQPSHQLFLSLFENGSDDLTRELLADFSAALNDLGVDGIWMHTSRFKTGSADRMTMLSEIRNHALRPLMPYAGTGTLIFMNDVATCPEDILELIYQRQLQTADVVIGTDWITLGDGKTTLYDLWATRGINGELPFMMVGDSGLEPISTSNDWMRDYWITQRRAVRARWLNGLPLPIYSGWGGMAAFDAALFTVDHLRFRSSSTAGWVGGSSVGAWGKLIDTPNYLDGDCPGDSECKLIYRDVWNLRNGKAKIALAPKTRTVYKVKHWAAMGLLETLWRKGARSVLGKDKVKDKDKDKDKSDEDAEKVDPELIDWGSVKAPDSVVCMASRTKDGQVVDVWGIGNGRYHLNPLGGGAAGAL